MVLNNIKNINSIRKKRIFKNTVISANKKSDSGRKGLFFGEKRALFFGRLKFKKCNFIIYVCGYILMKKMIYIFTNLCYNNFEDFFVLFFETFIFVFLLISITIEIGG